MIPVSADAVGRQIQALWTAGTFTGLGDAQLLDRFLEGGEDAAEAAFRELVNRHGPMVMGVCRQILRRPHDAEDAFQATFLVLVRKARSIRVRDSLAPWLYGVAYRTAHRARATSSRYRAGDVESVAELADPTPEGAFDPDVPPLLHEELARLPGKYRDPIVLCHLEGKSHEEAAGLLAWPVGTLSGRLSRGRRILRARLERRGVSAPSAALAARWLTGNQVALTPSLVETTLAAAARLAAAGTISNAVLSLTQGVLNTMLLDRIKALALALVVVGAASGGVATLSTLRATGAPRAQDGENGAAQPQLLTSVSLMRERNPRPPEGPISEIRFEGNATVPAEKLTPKLLSKTGQPLDIKTIGADVNTLLGTKWFTQVDAYYDESPPKSGRYALIFSVHEPPPVPKNSPQRADLRHRAPFIRSSSIIVAESPDRRSLQAISLEENRDWQKLVLPPGVTASPMVSEDTVAPTFKGKTIRQVAAFSKFVGVWRAQSLWEPAADEVHPLLLPGGAVYQVGNDVYAFSAFMGAWGVLHLEGAEKPRVSYSEKDVTVLHGNSLYVFSLRQGRFSSGIELNPEPVRPESQGAGPAR